MKYGLEEQTLQTIFLIFGKYPEVEEVILYGSRAKGNFKPFSDIDITLKGKISPVGENLFIPPPQPIYQPTSHNQSKSDYNTKGPSSKLHFNRLPTR